MSHIFWERVKQQHENIRQNYQIWAKFRPDEAARWLESTAPDFAKSITGGTDENH